MCPLTVVRLRRVLPPTKEFAKERVPRVKVVGTPDTPETTRVRLPAPPDFEGAADTAVVAVGCVAREARLLLFSSLSVSMSKSSLVCVVARRGDLSSAFAHGACRRSWNGSLWRRIGWSSQVREPVRMIAQAGVVVAVQVLALSKGKRF